MSIFWLAYFVTMTFTPVLLMHCYGQDESAYKFAKYSAFFWSGVVVAGAI